MRFLYLTFFFINFSVFASSFQIEVLRNGEKSTGVGFFIDEGGMAMTSHHVVSGADVVFAKIDGASFSVVVIGYDEVMDTAIIAVDNYSNKGYYDISNSKAALGEVVTLDRINTTYSGTIVSEGESEFQVDIDIVQGFSGSPILCHKKVCGIVVSYNKGTNHAIATKSEKFLKTYKDMLRGRAFKKKNTGIYVMNLTRDVLVTLGIDISEKPSGVLVANVQTSKFMPWDIITHLNGHPINNVDALQNTVSRLYETDIAEFMVIRTGKIVKVEI